MKWKCHRGSPIGYKKRGTAAAGAGYSIKGNCSKSLLAVPVNQKCHSIN